MKKLKIVILLLVILLLLTGCGYGEIKGQVINKRHTPTRTIMQPIYTGKIMTIVPITHSEKWEIQIQKEENRRNKNNVGKYSIRRI